MRSYDPDQRKILSAVAHAACLIGWAWVPLLVPIAILLLSEDPIVKDNAKQSLNFQVNIILYSLVFLILAFLLIGIPLLFVVGIVSFVMPIFAILSVAANPDRPYRYPFVFHFF
ncbi:MAG: DUF4870 domain-containing protein [Cyanobacteria bacterium RM1_2_2]|nr:DUF4870 domain-containing protein [Cyanobacteria bacterium RM1_2_2]